MRTLLKDILKYIYIYQKRKTYWCGTLFDGAMPMLKIPRADSLFFPFSYIIFVLHALFEHLASFFQTSLYNFDRIINKYFFSFFLSPKERIFS
jgi:hypothetical protein